MRKKLSILLALVLVLGMSLTQPAFAAEQAEVSTEAAVEGEIVITPYGALSGYGGTWHGSSSTTGSFTVPVSGISWPTAQLTFTIEDFPSDAWVRMTLKRPNGTVAYDTLSNAGDLLTMSNPSWRNITFATAPTGNYTVTYEVGYWNKSGAPNGRIMCWIY